jgi:uncharacterized membrane protein YgcG
MIWQRRWLRPGVPAGAILIILLAAFLAGVPRAFADTNLVRVDPSGVAVAPGGSFHVGVVDDPSAATLAAWVIELTFDPAVVTTKGADCRSIATPGGAVGAFDCETADTNNSGRDDTVKILGAVLFSRSGAGLTNESTLADITFQAVGGPGSCSDLTLRILIHADAQGQETGARVQDGRVCIAGDAPPAGTASPFPETPRTSEPTPPGTGVVALTPGGVAGQTAQPGSSSGSGVAGQTAQPGSSSGSGGASGSGGHTTAPNSNSGTPGAAATSVSGDGGTSTAVWLIGAVAVLVIAAVGAWGIVRLRGGRPGPGPDA